MEKLKDIYHLLKINHYIKNLIIFLPVIFTRNIENISILWETIKVFVAFCMMSSAVYIFNDLEDISTDKKHPLKKKRPIASGRISPKSAKIVLSVLLFINVCIGQFINLASNISLWAYFILNICYSLWLKNIRFLDMVCIAFGFVLRIASGFYILLMPLSWSVEIMTFLTSIFFTSSKRVLENNFLKEIIHRRQAMRYMNPLLLKCIMYISAVFAVILYAVVAKNYSVYIPGLYLTVIPFIIIIARLLYLIKKTDNHDDPMNFMEKDKWIKVIALFSLLFLIAIYIR